jgi:pimeloyl-ACP methyl ester carboxylesterase
MERLLADELRGRMDELPCLRVVMLGHSHGGVTVTSVTAALDETHGDRMLGVLIDRSAALYDRPASEMPVRTPLLNFFQTNEGWHGDFIGAPNVQNFDESAERAPLAPSEGGTGEGLVSHRTLDDAPATQSRAVDAIIEWASR